MANRYWVGGTGTWTTTTTNWSATSGGAAGASAPTTADSVFFDQAGTYTVTLTGALNCLDITVSAGTVTFVTGTTPTLNIAGSVSVIAGTVWTSNALLTFTASDARTITSNGTNFLCSFTFNGTGSWSLQDNLIITGNTTLTAGTLALGTYTYRTQLVSSSNSNTRTINFGTGKFLIVCAQQVGIWTTTTVTGLIILGTPLVECTGGGTGVSKTISTGPLTESQAISFSLLETTGTVTYLFNATATNNRIKNLILNGTQTINNNLGITIFGDFTHETTNGTTTFINSTALWTFAATSGSYNITPPVAGFTYGNPWTFGPNASTATYTVQNNLSLGSSTLTLTNGTFDFTSKTITAGTITILTGTVAVSNLTTASAIAHTSGTLTLGTNNSVGTYTLTAGTLSLGTFTLTATLFSSSNSNTRTINFGTGKIAIVRSTVATIWTTAIVTGLTVTGTPLVECSGGGSAIIKTISTGVLSEANSISFSLLETTDTVTYAFTANNVVRNLVINGLQTVSNIAITIFGSFTHLTTNGTTTFTAGANAWTFAATSGSYNITNIAGFTYDFPWIFNGTGGTWVIQNNLVIGSTRALTWNNGTLDLNNKTLTGSVGITMVTGTFTLNNTGGTTLSTTVPITHTSGTLNLGTNLTTTSTAGYTLSAGTLALVTFTLSTPIFSSSGAGVRLLNFGTGKIVLNGAVTATIWNTATVTNLTTSGTSLVESIGGGTGVTKTISTGVLSEANSISFSLLETTGTVTYAFTANNVVRNLITNGLQTVSNIAILIYGDFTHLVTNGTTTFTAGANAWTFAATSGSYNITNIAGFTYDFPWIFNGIGGTWVIQNNLVIGSTRALTFTNGTVDFNNKTLTGSVGITMVTGTFTLNNTGGTTLSTTVPITHTSGTLNLGTNLTTSSATGYTLSAGTLALVTFTLTTPVFSSSNANARTLNFGAGKIVLNGAVTATIWNTATVTNLTVTGTPLVESIGGGTGVTKTISTGVLSEANSISFSLLNTTGTVTYAFTASNTVRNLITNGLQTVSNIAILIYGSFTHLTTNGTTTFTAGANAWTFAATSGSYNITNIAGFTYDFPWIFGSATSTAIWSLLNNLTLGSTRIFTLTAGTIDLNDLILTAQSFNSSNSNVRVLAFGTTGQFVSPANNVTIWDNSTATNFTYTGTPRIYSTYTGATGTRTFNVAVTAGSTTTTIFDVSIGTSGTGIVLAAATDSVALNGFYNNVNLIGITQTLGNTTRTIYGNLIVPGSGGTLTAGTLVTTLAAPAAMTTTTTNGRILDFPITIGDILGSTGTVQLADSLTIGSTRTLTLTYGTLDTNNFTLSAGQFSSTNSNSRTIAFGTTGQLTLVNNNTTIWNTTIGTGFIYSGTARVFATYSGTVGTRTITFGTLATAYLFNIKFNATSQANAFTIAASTDIISISTNVNDFDFTNGTNTLAVPLPNIFGNFTVPVTGGTLPTTTTALTFSGTSGTKTIITNGRTLNFPITFNGQGSTFQLGGSLTLTASVTTNIITLTAGILDLNNSTITSYALASNNSNIRSILFGTSGQFILTGNNATIVNFTTASNFTYTGTVKINSNYTGATGTRTFNFGGSGGAFPNNVFNVTITGSTGLIVAAATDTIALTGIFGDIDLSGLTNTLSNTLRTSYGNLTVPASGGTFTAGAVATTLSAPSTAPSTTAYSAYFDGNGDYLSLIGQNLSATDWTIECWVLFNNFTNATQHIFNFGTDTNNRYALSRTTAGVLQFSTVNGGLHGDAKGITTILANTWYQVVVERNSSTGIATLYVNGQIEAVNTSASLNAGTNWAMGWRQFGGGAGDYLNGNISNFRVTNALVYAPNSGQSLFTTAGTFSWVAPAGVTSVSAVAVGAGGSGSSNSPAGGGGGLGWKNNITVVPGQSYTVVVGAGNTPGNLAGDGVTGGDSYFISLGTVSGTGGQGAGISGSNAAGGTYTGDGGGNGGTGGRQLSGNGGGGGGGAGGYAGTGGAGADYFIGTIPGPTSAGLGGGGGGGGVAFGDINGNGNFPAAGAGGGGVGILGQGVNGAAGTNSTITAGILGGGGGGGGGGSLGGGAAGANGIQVSGLVGTSGGGGGIFGGGGGGGASAFTGGPYPESGGASGRGAVRIIWGAGRVFPSLTYFTPPTTSLTSLGNTVLLTCQNNTFIDNSTNTYSIISNGGTTPSYISPFSGQTTTIKTITTNGRTLDFPVTIGDSISGAGINQLAGALTLGSTRSLTLTSNTLDLNNFTASALSFNSTNINVRSILFGTSGQITVVGSGATLVDISTATNFSWTGISKIVSTYALGVGTRTFLVGSVAAIAEAFAFDVIIGTGSGINLSASATDSLVLTGQFANFDLSNMAGSTATLTNTARAIFGNFWMPVTNGVFTAGTEATTFSSTNASTRTITTNVRTLDFPITFDGVGGTWTLQNNLVIGATRALTWNNGTLDLNNRTLTGSVGITINGVSFTLNNTGGTLFSTTVPITHTSGTLNLGTNLTTSSATGYTLNAGTLSLSSYILTTIIFSSASPGTRTIAFGTGKIVLNRSTAGTVWNTTTVTNLTTSGTSLVESIGGGTGVTKTISTGALSEANSINFSLLETTGTVTYTLSGSAFHNLIFNGIQTINNGAITIYGDFTHLVTNGTTTFTAGANTWTFAGTSGSYNITNIAGFTYDFPWRFNGIDGTWTLQNNLVIGSTRALTWNNGTLDLNNRTLTGSVGITMVTGTFTLNNTGGTLFSTTVPITHTSGTLNLGTNLTTSSATGYTFTAGTLALVTFTLSTPIFSSSGGGVRLLNFGTGKIVLNGAVTATIWNTATVTNLTTSGTSLVECLGGGAAVTKTISTGALSEANSINFSLLETTDTVTYAFTANNVVRNLVINGLQTVSNIAITIFGNFTHLTTNGTTTFTAGANAWTFGATSGTQTIASVSEFTYDFPWTFGAAGSTATTYALANNLILGVTRTATLTAGTLDLAGFALSTGIFSSSGSSTRAIAFGSGNIALTSTTVAAVLTMATATGFTFTGTGGFTRNQAATANMSFGQTGGTTSNAPDLTVNAGASALTILTGSYFKNLNFTGSTCTVSAIVNLAGNLTLASGGTYTSLLPTFRATATITSNGRTLGSTIINGTGITVTLTSDMTVGITNTTTLTAGTLDLAGFTLSTGIFSSSGSLTRSIVFGSQDIYLNSTTAATTVLSMTTATNFTYTGTGGFIRDQAATATVAFGSTTGGSTSNAPNLTVNSGASTLSISIGSFFKDVDFTGSTCTVTALSLNMAGNLTLASGGTYTGLNPTFLVSTTFFSIGKTLGGFGVNGTGITVTLADALTTGTTNTTTLTAGTLNLNNFVLATGLFASTNANTRAIAFGYTSKIRLTAAAAVTYWNTATPTNFSYTGTGNIETAGSGAVTKTINTGAMTEAQSLSFTLLDTAGTVAFTANNVVDNLTINGSFTLTNIAITIYGDYTYTAATALVAGANIWTFVSTSSQSITASGTTHDFPWTFNGLGGTFLLQSAVTIGSTRTTTLTNGTIDLNGFTYSTGLFTTGVGTKSILFDGGTLAITGSGTTAFNNVNPTGFTSSQGATNGSISMTSASAKTFAGGTSTYSGGILNQGGTGTLTVTGSNTFENLTASITNSANTTISFSSGSTTTFTAFTLTGNATYQPTVNSITTNSTATIYCALGLSEYVTGSNYIRVQNIAFTPFATNGTDYVRWYIGVNSVILNSVGVLAQTYSAGTSFKVYVLEAGSSWTVPSDFNTANNTIYLYGGGGGGGGGRGGTGVTAETVQGGPGGGGGGFTQVNNLFATNEQVISYSVGAGGTAGTNSTTAIGPGGNAAPTTFSTYTANGGAGGGIGSSSGGAGGTGSTFNGAAGGTTASVTTSLGNPNSSGGGGGGAGGSLGGGAAGANGISGGSTGNYSGSGGGGNSGGTAAVGGVGGNNNAGAGGGATSGVTGTLGGGGAGSVGTLAGFGGFGIEILNSIGSGGGGGGGGIPISGPAGAGGAGARYGGGGGGGGGGEGTASAGATGGTGGIIIVFLPGTAPTPSTGAGKFFLLLM